MEFPAGIYYFGDPVHFLNREYLDAWADQEYPEGYYSGFIAFYTASGAGVYSDNKGAIYEVTTGCLGLIPETLVRPGNNLEIHGRRIDTRGRKITISESDGTIIVKIGSRVAYEVETLLLDDEDAAALLESDDDA